VRLANLDIDALGWTLVHFLWQGALIAALLQLFLVSGRKSSVQVRYLARCLALAAMAIAPVVTFVLLRGDSPLRSAATPAWSVAAPAATLAQRGLPWVVALWSLGAVFLSLRLFLGFLRVQRLQRHGSGGELPERWQRSFERLAEALGVRAVARVVDSAVLAAPAVVGWLKPVVLIPARVLTGLDEDQILALLAHELAHVRRHDYLVNLVQSVLEALLFYHPAVWWVSAGIRTEREYCCDDVAVELTHAGVAYARALTALETWRGAQFPVVVSTTGGSLMHRIQRLLGIDHSHSSHGALHALGALALATTIAASAHGFAGAPDPSAVQDGESTGKLRHVHVDESAANEFKARRSSRSAASQDMKKVHEHLRRVMEQLHEHGIDTSEINGKVRRALEDAGVTLDVRPVISTDRRSITLELQDGDRQQLERAMQQLHEHGIDADQLKAKIHEALGRSGATEELLHRALAQQGAAQDHVKRAMQQLHEHGIDVEQIQAKIHEAIDRAGVSEELLHRTLEPVHEHLQRALKEVQEHEWDDGEDHQHEREQAQKALRQAQRQLKELRVPHIDVQSILKDVDVQSLMQDLDVQSVMKHVDNQSIMKGVDVQSIMKDVDIQSIMKDVDVQSLVRDLDVQSIMKDVDVQSIMKHVHEAIEESGAVHMDGDMKRLLHEAQRHQHSDDSEGSDARKRNDDLKAQIAKLRGQEAELRDEYKKASMEWNDIRSRSQGESDDVKAMKKKAKAKQERGQQERAQADYRREIGRTRKEQTQSTEDVMRQVLEALEKAGVDDEVRAKVKKALAGRGKSV